MKTRSEVTSEKLRGGFYSPDELVRRCLDITVSLLNGRSGLRLLEPSCGDGAFLRGLASHDLGRQIGWVTGVEPLASEAAKSRRALSGLANEGEVLRTSAVEWAISADAAYDVAVGNPPFVRFQFVDPAEKAHASALADRMALQFRGVSNLWIPVLLGALNALRVGGAFAFIVPAEILSGVSAQVARTWLQHNAESLSLDLFAPGSFPNVLQEVVILSGVRVSSPSGVLNVRDHGSGHGHLEGAWTHELTGEPRSWTRYLLRPDHLAALEEALALDCVSPLRTVARFEVAAVTGANDYFCVDEDTMRSTGLDRWSVPLLARTRLAPGLRFSVADHADARSSGAKAHLLDFSADRPDPERSKRPANYLRRGEEAELNSRYKTSIREPWYRVPLIRSEPLMMSKRSHRYPRVILNDAGAVTTDTIYRGWTLSRDPVDAARFTAGFHNSMTMLTAEIEGRSFGGGVLELVPSEVARLSVPVVPGLEAELDRLDAFSRAVALTVDEDELIDETDKLLAKAEVGLDPGLMGVLSEARRLLMSRRLLRN